jgi:hypothetical protein
VRLSLPQTGVCGGPAGTTESGSAEASRSFVDIAAIAGAPPAKAAAGCCGGPAPAASGACCALDAEAKAAGQAGCGCGVTQPAAASAPAPAGAR